MRISDWSSDVCSSDLAAGELGIPARDDFNGACQEGAGYFQLTAKNGRRCSTAVGYLNPARKRPNLHIVTHAHTERVIFDGRRAAGFPHRPKGRPAVVRCRGEVAPAAATGGSPHIPLPPGR